MLPPRPQPQELSEEDQVMQTPFSMRLVIHNPGYTWQAPKTYPCLSPI